MPAISMVAFNRGRISKLALARTDFSRTQLSAEIQTNWMPRALGSMMLRPGLGYTGATKSNLQSVSIPFVFATDDTARVELTNLIARVWIDDELVSRATVTTTVTNGGFDTDVSGWSDQDGGTSVSVWATGGYLSLTGDGNAAAKRRQQVTVSGGNIGVRHALNIVINRGPVLLRVGSTAGGDDYIAETTLETGYHSLAFTPSGDFHVDLFNYREAASLVDSINVASSGTMELTSPYATADLSKMRWDQSGDVIFIACDGYRQRRIERRAAESWSIVEYKSDDGPFMVQNVSPVTISPSATSGDVTLTASHPMFKSTQVGALFKLTHTGQLEDADLSGADQFCDPIRVTGIDGTRAFAVIATGTWVGTLTLQYSVSEPGDWVDAPLGTFTTNVAISYDDTLDNQVIYYRFGFKTGEYTSGTASVSLSSSSGSTTGIARVTGFTSSTVVSAGIIQEFGSATATSDWAESYWSAYRGFPTAVAFDGGRLWWAGRNHQWGSASDAYDSFDDTIEGDSGPISRTIGAGPVDSIFWLLSGSRLLRGAAGTIAAIRSSSLDEPVTPTNYNPKDVSTQGSANIAAAKVDTGAVYVQQGGTRLFEAVYDGTTLDYTTGDLSVHVPEIGEPAIVKVVVQRQPETRAHCIRSDGTVAILILDRVEEVKCWIDVETEGEVEDAVVLPGTVEDQVYYTVKRMIDGGEVRYHEKWAMESECVGGTVNKQLDAFMTWSGSSSLLTGFDHLEGETVPVWADGEYLGDFAVSSGNISVGVTVSDAVAGLPYTATYKSTKLAYGVEAGTALCMKKKIHQLGVIAVNLHPQGLEYGPDFDLMDNLPLTEDYADVDQDVVREAYDEEMFTFPGEYSTDSRLCLRATAPKPVTLLACVINLETNQKA